MPSVTLIEADGTEHTIEVALGESIMQAAVNHLVPGIDGDCGGLCACGTCHVYVDDNWQAQCGEPDELESGILEFAYEVSDQSRLSCQILMAEALDGLVLRLPSRQY